MSETHPTTDQHLSCPFCGHRDIRTHHRGHPSAGEWVIECHGCSCELTGFASQKDAWTRWNHRAATNTTSAAAQVAGAKKVDRSTPTYTADNVDSKSVAAVDRSRACAKGGEHAGFYYCKKCGIDLTPDIPEQHGRYNDSPGAAR